MTGIPLDDEEAEIATSPKSDLFKLQLKKMCNISASFTTLFIIFLMPICAVFSEISFFLLFRNELENFHSRLRKMLTDSFFFAVGSLYYL